MTHPTLEQIADAIGVLKQAGLLPKTTKNGKLLTHEEVGKSLFGKPRRKEGRKRRPRNVLTPSQIDLAYKSHKEGVSGVQLAKQYGVSQGQMSRRLKDYAAK